MAQGSTILLFQILRSSQLLTFICKRGKKLRLLFAESEKDCTLAPAQYRY